MGDSRKGKRYSRLSIEYADGKYTARVISPENEVEWHSGEAMEHDALSHKLTGEKGWHQRDVAEAFFKANPELLEVLRGTEFEWLIDRDRTAIPAEPSLLRRLFSNFLPGRRRR